MILHLASPWWLLLLLILPIQVFWHFRGAAGGALRYPATRLLEAIPPTVWVRLRHSTVLLAVAGEAALILALARPQTGQYLERITSEGIDIVLAIDVSGSMQAFDLGDRERLDVARDVVERFIAGRTTDRIGMVVFAGESFTQCPLTIDYGILKTLLRNVTITMDETIPDGTAIGMAIATATNRLRRNPTLSKVVILLTDGSNNAGIIDPLTAARAAARFGVKIYTVGVGVQGRAPIRVRDPFFGERVEFIEDSLNEDILREVAAITGGVFFRATSETALEDIYERIGQLEQTEVEMERIPRYSEITFNFALIPIGLLLLLAQFVLSHTVFRTLP
jgi:Ca-activated chloride channel homolog